MMVKRVLLSLTLLALCINTLQQQWMSPLEEEEEAAAVASKSLIQESSKQRLSLRLHSFRPPNNSRDDFPPKTFTLSNHPHEEDLINSNNEKTIRRSLGVPTTMEQSSIVPGTFLLRNHQQQRNRDTPPPPRKLQQRRRRRRLLFDGTKSKIQSILHKVQSWFDTNLPFSKVMVTVLLFATFSIIIVCASCFCRWQRNDNHVAEEEECEDYESDYYDSDDDVSVVYEDDDEEDPPPPMESITTTTTMTSPSTPPIPFSSSRSRTMIPRSGSSKKSLSSSGRKVNIMSPTFRSSHAMEQFRDKVNTRTARKLFDQYDPNRTGYISKSDLKQIIKDDHHNLSNNLKKKKKNASNGNGGGRDTNKNVEHILRKFGGCDHNNNKMSFDQFKRYWISSTTTTT